MEAKKFRFIAVKCMQHDILWKIRLCTFPICCKMEGYFYKEFKICRLCEKNVECTQKQLALFVNRDLKNIL